MGVFSFFSSSNGQDKSQENAAPAVIVVDLGELKIGSTMLGSPIADADPFQAALAITLLRDGILSNPIQRKAYGVTKHWPPQ